MRLLSALVLTHCFGCVIPKDSDDDLTIITSGSHDARHRKVIAESEPVLTIADLDDKGERYNDTTTKGTISQIEEELSPQFQSNDSTTSEGRRLCTCPEKVSRKYQRRRLLDYREGNFLGRRAGGGKSRNQRVRLRKRKRMFAARDADDADDENSEDWDDWGSWSSCSVTCGCGRQVRWRHCSTENCESGLKMAQMKSCRLKACDSTGFLHWLGIKP